MRPGLNYRLGDILAEVTDDAICRPGERMYVAEVLEGVRRVGWLKVRLECFQSEPPNFTAEVVS